MADVRDISDSDLRRVREIVAECYRQIAGAEGLAAREADAMVDRRTSNGALEERLREGECFVACQKDRIAGFAAVRGNEITLFCVDPAVQRQGIGRQLFHRVEQAVREAGFLVVATEATTSAVPFCRAMGMSVAGRRPNDTAPSPDHDFVLFRKLLL